MYAPPVVLYPLRVFPIAFAVLLIVMGTGNPRVNFRAPAPLPAETRTRNHGYGFPATTGKGTLRPVGSMYPHGFLY
jgi:hypothetical protein